MIEVWWLSRRELAVFASMCMVYDDEGRVLVQDRRKSTWTGISFPGGHVEPGESFTEAVIREVYEETGLQVHDPVLCGVKQFPLEDDTRFVVFLYKTNRFSGTLRASEEGPVFWVPRGELAALPLAPDMEHMLPIFENTTPSELFYVQCDGRWQAKLL